MEISKKQPKDCLKPLLKKQSIAAENIAAFKNNLEAFLEKIKDQNREGKQETDLRDFLNDAF